MKTIREEIIRIKDSNGKLIGEGDAVMMLVDGRVCAGIFLGLGTRGAWKFRGLDEYEDIVFSIQPRTIVSMYKIGN